MRVVVLGAAGHVGRLTVRAALDRGHLVTAFARSLAPLRAEAWFDGARVEEATGDIRSPGEVATALRGRDAAIWTIGAPLNGRTLRAVPDLCTEGTRNVIAALREHGIRRFVCMTSIGVGDSRGAGRWVFRNLIQPVLLQRIFDDRERQEALVRASGLDWVIVRPAELTDERATGPARVVLRPRGGEATTVARAQVAAFLVEQLTDDTHLGAAPVLTR